MHVVEIVYINLWSNIFRRIYVCFFLFFQSIPFRRSPGVLYENDSSKYKEYMSFGLENYLSDDGNINRANGVIGCWIAHAKALESIVSENGFTVIIEDDFFAGHGFLSKTNELISQLKGDFDIVLCDPWGSGPKEEHRLADGLYKVGGDAYPSYGGSHCLLVNNKRIRKILKHIYASKVRDYDGFLLESRELNVYVIYTGSSKIRNFGSNISKRPFWKSFIGGL